MHRLPFAPRNDLKEACLYAEMTKDELVMLNLHHQFDWVLDLAKRHMSGLVYQGVSREG